ncbi:hypothetical protein [Polluticaenibacter yanchengensis]|uniref:Uncharacterized protein n=1 Tax=Polluticaenibacter yanchengensis TaxID=3014562 RepID=A0ABT4UNA9_9BACT|nr:hypothetical protein [Chitinophagaceae bacterium LY-5]
MSSNFLHLAAETRLDRNQLLNLCMLYLEVFSEKQEDFFVETDNGYAHLFFITKEEMIISHTGDESIVAEIMKFSSDDTFISLLYNGTFGRDFLDNLIESLYRNFGSLKVIVMDDFSDNIYSLVSFYHQWKEKDFFWLL